MWCDDPVKLQTIQYRLINHMSNYEILRKCTELLLNLNVISSKMTCR